MNSASLQDNAPKIISFLLSQLERQIYLLRISLHGSIEEYCPKNSSITKEILNIIQSEDFENSRNLSIRDFRLMLDCCDIEKILRRIQHELTQKKSLQVLAVIRDELENERTGLKKHRKMIEAKQKEIEKLKKELSDGRDQSDFVADRSEVDTRPDKTPVTAFDELDFLRKLMEQKQKSQRDCYDHRIGKVQKSIEWYERETRTQAQADVQLVNFWILKFDDFTGNVDMSLREMFDSLTSKRRNLQILKKYRRLNQEKISKLQKLIEERENYIQNHEKREEMEAKRRKEEQKLYSAATLIQAVWKGTMVRKGLGPYQVKKSKKKGKAMKGKGKGKKK